MNFVYYKYAKFITSLLKFKAKIFNFYKIASNIKKFHTFSLYTHLGVTKIDKAENWILTMTICNK